MGMITKPVTVGHLIELLEQIPKDYVVKVGEGANWDDDIIEILVRKDGTVCMSRM